MSVMSNVRQPMTFPYGGKFCKFCSDLGLPDANSHWLRAKSGPNGTITCPVLKEWECRYCRLKGHTTRYCPALKAKEVRGGAHKRPAAFISSDGFTHVGRKDKPAAPILLSKESAAMRGMFAALDFDEQEEEKLVCVAVCDEEPTIEPKPYLEALLKPSPAWGRWCRANVG